MKSIMLSVLAVFLLVSSGYADSHIPLPDDLNISPPDENVPEHYARFSGTWNGGKWSGNLPHTLIVESIDAEGSVVAVYAWGDYAGWNITKGWSRHEGVISGNRLTLETFRNGANARYELVDDGTLLGRYMNAAKYVSKARLTKSK